MVLRVSSLASSSVPIPLSGSSSSSLTKSFRICHSFPLLKDASFFNLISCSEFSGGRCKYAGQTVVNYLHPTLMFFFFFLLKSFYLFIYLFLNAKFWDFHYLCREQFPYAYYGLEKRDREGCNLCSTNTLRSSSAIAVLKTFKFGPIPGMHSMVSFCYVGFLVILCF